MKMTTDNIFNQLGSEENHKHDRMIRKELEDGTLIIGKAKYDVLKKIPETSILKNQKEMIKNFEDYYGITEYNKKIAEQFEKQEADIQRQENRIKNLVITKETVWFAFKKIYKELYEVDFVSSEDTKKNIAPLIRYFAKDDEFLNYGAKDKNGELYSKPGLDKGLLIVGGFGNGKSSIMRTFQRCFIGLEDYRFGWFSANEIVLRYEEASRNKNSEILENFWQLLVKKDLYLDDVKSEPDANAYGKKNLMNILIQERYNKKLKTHITCNYAQGHNNNLDEALKEFKSRYSNQVYDRLFEMFNIIEFTGKSFRK